MSTTTNHFRAVSWGRLKLAIVAGLLVATTGCGQQYADVTGKVAFQNRPVVYGTVSLIASDQMSYTGMIQTDGTFTVVGVPVGPVKVGVYSPDPYYEPPIPPAAKAQLEKARRESGVPQLPKPPKGKWVRLPPKYSDPVSSGVVAEVTAASAVLDVRLD